VLELVGSCGCCELGVLARRGCSAATRFPLSLSAREYASGLPSRVPLTLPSRPVLADDFPLHLRECGEQISEGAT
jgi:hypothetical protein